MSDQNNASVISPLPNKNTALFVLPTRGEKRFISVTTPPRLGNVGGIVDWKVSASDMELSAAISPFMEYVLLRIPGRGTTETGLPDASAAAYFQFLINPAQIAITRQQIDAQAMARAGWQIGVWGEDFLSITMEGKTPGRYFANGLTDAFADFSMSFRHLEALEVFVENNGYWFEGEQSAEGPLATADFSRRQIKMHSDVELTVGEFIWSGMFESMTIREDSQNPFLASFSLSFIAWKEAFRQETPYKNPIGGSVQRGHIPLLEQTPDATVTAVQNGVVSATVSTTVTASMPNIDPESAALTTLLPTQPGANWGQS